MSAPTPEDLYCEMMLDPSAFLSVQQRLFIIVLEIFGSDAVRMWGSIPDDCEMPGCCRKGVWGNENVKMDGRICCDYCDYCSCDRCS